MSELYLKDKSDLPIATCEPHWCGFKHVALQLSGYSLLPGTPRAQKQLALHGQISP